MRRTSNWATAPSTPITMVRPDSTSRTDHIGSIGGNTSVNTRISAYTPTLVRRPANTAVTEADGVG